MPISTIKPRKKRILLIEINIPFIILFLSLFVSLYYKCDLEDDNDDIVQMCTLMGCDGTFQITMDGEITQKYIIELTISDISYLLECDIDSENIQRTLTFIGNNESDDNFNYDFSRGGCTENGIHFTNNTTIVEFDKINLKITDEEENNLYEGSYNVKWSDRFYPNGKRCDAPDYYCLIGVVEI
jgi:hypothetical protein